VTPTPTPDEHDAAEAHEAADARPLLRVVGGSPTAEEVAVLTAVVSAVGGGDQAPAERVRRGGWNDPGAQHRRMPIPGPNAWRASLR
jgi:hypothetical protein